MKIKICLGLGLGEEEDKTDVAAGGWTMHILIGLSFETDT